MSGLAIIRHVTCDAFHLTSRNQSAGRNASVLFRAEGHVGTRTVHGSGEGIVHADPGASVAVREWQPVHDAVDELCGTTLSARAEHVDGDIRSLLRLLGGNAALAPGLLAGLDMCLSDFAAQATGTRLAGVMGADHNERTRNVSRVDMRQGSDQLHLLPPTTSSSVVRLTGITGHHTAIEAASIATGILGTKPALWLQLRRRPTEAQAYQLVAALADRIREGRLSDHVVLYEPVANVDTLADLQSVADAKTGHVDGPGLVVMSHPRSAGLARAAAGRVRALELDPHDLGGAHPLFDLANELHATHGEQRIAVSLPSDTLGVAARAIPDLAAALPRCDYLEAPRRESSSPVAETLGRARVDPFAISRARAAGKVVKRYAPHDEQTPEHGSEDDRKPNDYSHEPVLRVLDMGARTGSCLFERAALRAGLTVMRFARDVITLDHPDLPEPLGFALGGTPRSSGPSRRLVQDDVLTRRLLLASDIPASEPGAGFTGSRGHHEFLVVDGQVVSVLACAPPAVVGDGRSTVVDLVLNKNVARRQNPGTHSRPVEFTRDALRLLVDQNLTVESIPAAGLTVVLGAADAGADETTQVLDETDAAELDLAVRAAQSVVGLDLCTVILGEDGSGDHRRPVVEAIDGTPDIARHQFPVHGNPVDVADHLVRRSCEPAGFALSAAVGDLQAHIEVWGHLQGGDPLSRLTEDVDGTVLHVLGSRAEDRRSEATVIGNLMDIAVVSSAVFTGPFGKGVERIVTKPVEWVERPTIPGHTP